jgi:DNA-binding LytR/AlgR family response regulator
MTLAQLRQLLATANATPSAATLAGGAGTTAPVLLSHIQASVGSAIRLVPVSEVVYFEAADKYVRVLTQAHEYLIRTPLKDLLPQLPGSFWQVHRGTVVPAEGIEVVSRDEAGKLWLWMPNRSWCGAFNFLATLSRPSFITDDGQGTHAENIAPQKRSEKRCD